MVNFFDRFPMLFESKMNIKYKKIFSITAFFLTIFFFFGQNVFGAVLALTNHRMDSGLLVVTAGLEPLIYLLGTFVFYIIIASSIFIGIGELYIRICEYFKIKSKLYDYMTKTKDVMTLDNFEYYEKYKNIEEDNKKNKKD
jgi:succinate dehydrogenase/fumarate reductase cytochrome b subunit